jgi:hypothetical protein
MALKRIATMTAAVIIEAVAKIIVPILNSGIALMGVCPSNTRSSLL